MSPNSNSRPSPVSLADAAERLPVPLIGSSEDDVVSSDIPEYPETIRERNEALRHAMLGATRAECEAALGKESVTDDPDGIHWNVAICREYWPPEVNRRRWQIMMELMKKRHEADEERSQLRAARTRTTRVIGPDGDVREVPEEVEQMIEFKSDGLRRRGLEGFRPVISPRVRRKGWRSVAGGSR